MKDKDELYVAWTLQKECHVPIRHVSNTNPCLKLSWYDFGHDRSDGLMKIKSCVLTVLYVFFQRFCAEVLNLFVIYMRITKVIGHKGNINILEHKGTTNMWECQIGLLDFFIWLDVTSIYGFRSLSFNFPFLINNTRCRYLRLLIFIMLVWIDSIVFIIAN